MKNRLPLTLQVPLLLLAFSFFSGTNLSAQSNCSCTVPARDSICIGRGGLWSLQFRGDSIQYVNPITCTASVAVGSSNVGLTIPPGYTVISYAIPSIGSTVRAGTKVTFHYYLLSLTTFERSDTLCFKITYLDSVAPKINTTLASPTVSCPGNYRSWWQAQIDTLKVRATDNCGIDSIYHNGPQDTTFYCGSITLTFTVRDTSGNKATTTATYTVTDTEKPKLSGGVLANVTIACNAAIPPVPALTTITASDNCDPAINNKKVFLGEFSTKTNTNICTDYSYTIRRTWSVTDTCGNRTDSIQTITVVDNIKPTFTVPGNITINCGADTSRTALGNISAVSDNCSSKLDTIFLQSIVTGTTCSSDSVKYIITRSWTVTDICGNTDTKTQTITVRDVTAPTGSFPGDITVDCSNAGKLSVTGTPTGLADNCTPAPTFVQGVDTLTAGSCVNNYVIRRPWFVRDACGNEIKKVQIITVVDSFPPKFTTAARDSIIFCNVAADAAFTSWVNVRGRAVASDNCSSTSNLTWQAFKSGTSTPPTLAAPDCGVTPKGIYRQTKVTFIVTDECGRRDSTSATFTVRDDTPPVVVCPDTTIVVNPPTGSCELTGIVPWPMVTENCNNIITTLNDSIFTTFSHIGSDAQETPVNPIEFVFNVPLPPGSAPNSGQLTIRLINADAEEPTEFFNVYGEDGALLDTMSRTPTQCGNVQKTFVLSAAKINAWAEDGQIEITVKPNIPANLPGRYAVNNICPGGGIKAFLNYTVHTPDKLVFQYSLNGGARLPITVPVTLSPGAPYAVAYYLTDCAKNESVCNFKVTVEDKEKPIVVCPPDMNLKTDPGVCTTDVAVPLYVSVSDNCSVVDPTIQTQPADNASRFMTFRYNPNLTDWVANDKEFIFTGLAANATPGLVEIIFTVKGDVESAGEYFTILGNDSISIGTTAVGQAHVTPGNCTTASTARFTISSQKFNQWASAGPIKFRAISNLSFPLGGVGSGINPCNPAKVTTNGDIDSVSMIYATIRYESVTPTFWSTGATVFDTVQLTPPLQPQKLKLNRDTTTFTYRITDKNGNDGACSFKVIVKDEEKPKAICGPTFVNINPSGFVIDTIFPYEINQGSSDNCGIDTMWVTPNLIRCDSAGIRMVVLNVKDRSGNVSTCTTFVNVTTTLPLPTAQSTCGGSSLQLFTNPPGSPGGGVVFKYTWYNPAGVIFSFDRNPIIQNAGLNHLGFYVVVIEGVTGCKSSATVQVTCEMLPLQKPVITAARTTVCLENDIQLTTTTVCGANVKYKWYSGVHPSGTLMQTTVLPTFSSKPSTAGTFSFYVVVERDTCASVTSTPVSISVNAKPVATPEMTSITLCAGSQLVLKSVNNALSSTCHWTGPCGFESFKCNPDPINNTTTCNSGLYQLVVTKDGCSSEPAFVSVNVVALPSQPTLTNTTSVNNPACQGSAVTLTASVVTGAVSYRWTSPIFDTTSTPTNVLTINDANIAKHAGQWIVKVLGNPCESLPSTASTVYIAPAPQSVSATSTPASVCEGQNVQLSATSATQNVTYFWTYPNGQSSAQQNPVLTNVTSGNKGNYLLTVTNQFGCSKQTTIALDVISRVNITGISSDVPACVTGPVSVNLNATIFPLDPGTYSYNWTGPGGFSSVSANAIIPNATLANSGPYSLVVTNVSGCSSLPRTVNVAVPAILSTPGAPVLSGANPFCTSENVTLTTTPYPGSAASYIWTTPTGSYTTAVPSLSLIGLNTADGGAYSVHYVVNSCPSSKSGATTLIVNPAPVSMPGANAPVCESQTIQLAVECTSGATYEWTGPGGFSSSVCNPTIANANPNLHSGTYTVRRRVAGCWSAVVPINVLVKPKPIVPAAINSGPYCSNTDNAVLSVTSNSATPGATYRWFDSSNVPLGAASGSLNFNIPNPSAYGNGSAEFYVVAALDGCSSLPSVPTLVRFNTIPANVAEAGPDVKSCEGETITLKATPVTLGSGLWTLSGDNTGVFIANPDQPSTTVSGLAIGRAYNFRWTLSNGACKNYSFDNTTVTLDKKETAKAGDPIVVCHATTTALKATPPNVGTGMWTQPPSQALLGVIITNPTSPNTTVSNLSAGNNYIFTWSITNSCGTSSDAVQVQVSNEDAFAGPDFVECGNGCVKLNATGALSGIGMWTSPDAAIRFTTPTDPKTTVCNLKAGNNILVWTINKGACGHFSVDSVIVSYQYAPELKDDQMNIPFNGVGTVNVLANDKILGNYKLNITKKPEHGTVTVEANGTVTYNPNRAYVGRDVITYQICIDNCQCITANINIIVGDMAACLPPSIITPNKDGINDAFIVPCMGDGSLFPKSRVSIFNQWGDEVFRGAPYRNNWEGTFDGEDLPTGTYFYIVDFGSGDKPLSGFLVIHR